MNPARDITLTQMSFCLKINPRRFLLITGEGPQRVVQTLGTDADSLRA
ncbi:MAG: hypothetical protein WAN11_16235 [Syntrophobacteraceae bacterium]